MKRDAAWRRATKLSAWMALPFTRRWRKPGSIQFARQLPASCGRPLGGCFKVRPKENSSWEFGGPAAVAKRKRSRSIKRGRMPGESAVSSREADGVPVIRITRWGNDGSTKLATRFDEILGQYRDRPGLIIDVRGNGGGQDDLAGQVVARFLKEPIIASISFHRQVPGQTFERTVERVEPRGPWRYEGRVAVLIDEGCLSACEHFVSGMAEAGALLCGTPTSGACGWIRPVRLIIWTSRGPPESFDALVARNRSPHMARSAECPA